MNKKIIIIVSAAVILLAGIGAGVYFLAIKPQSAAASASNGTNANNNAAGQNARANFANLKNITGSVLSMSSTDMIVDAGTAQSDVVWDATTRVTGNSVSDKAAVLTAGNTVTVNFTTTNGVDQASKISKIDLTAFTASGTPGQPGQGFSGGGAGANGGFRRGSGSGGSGSSGSSGVVRPTNTPRTSYTGTVTAVNGNTLTLTVSGFGGFIRPSGTGTPSTTPSVTPTPEVLSFDISAATFYVMQTKAVTDVQQGDTVQVTGTLQSNQQVMARSIVIE